MEKHASASSEAPARPVHASHVQDRHEQGFTTRQYMVNPDFELFHHKDDKLTEIEYHNHDFYEIYLFISGKVSFYIEGKRYKLIPGDIILVNNKEIHKMDIEKGEPYERVVIWINPDYIEKNSREGTNLFMCFASSSQFKYNLLRPGVEMLNQIKHIIAKLEKVCSTISYGSNILKDIYLCELVVYLNRAYLDTDIAEIEGMIIHNRTVSDVIQYINENLETELSLEVLAARFYLSKFHLLRKFKEHTGYTIHRFIRQKRLILAKALLKECDQITELCARCGFGDYSNFLRCFKQEFGLSPKKMQKKMADS